MIIKSSLDCDVDDSYKETNVFLFTSNLKKKHSKYKNDGEANKI